MTAIRQMKSMTIEVIRLGKMRKTVNIKTGELRTVMYL